MHGHTNVKKKRLRSCLVTLAEIYEVLCCVGVV
jgi:hypothetical protein